MSAGQGHGGRRDTTPWVQRLVFISYSGEDKAIAEKICLLLERDELPCWIAPRDVKPGHDYAEQILDAIESTRVMVLILSAHANASVFVKNEVERAISKGKVVIPLRIQDVQPSRGLELFVSRNQWIDAWTPPLPARVHLLAAAIHGLLGLPEIGEEEPPTPEPTPTPALTPTLTPIPVPVQPRRGVWGGIGATARRMPRRPLAAAALVGLAVVVAVGAVFAGVRLPGATAVANPTGPGNGTSPTTGSTSPTKVTIPEVPLGLLVSSSQDASITVSWDAADGATGYIVTDNRSVVHVDAPAVTYQWSTNPGESKCFQVASYNAVGSSLWTDPWQCTTAMGTWTGPDVPTNVSATATSSSQIVLSWTDNATTETGYRIRRWNGMVWAVVADGLPVDSTTYNDKGLASSSTYDYYVCAYNSGGESCSDGSQYADATTGS